MCSLSSSQSFFSLTSFLPPKGVPLASTETSSSSESSDSLESPTWQILKLWGRCLGATVLISSSSAAVGNWVCLVSLLSTASSSKTSFRQSSRSGSYRISWTLRLTCLLFLLSLSPSRASSPRSSISSSQRAQSPLTNCSRCSTNAGSHSQRINKIEIFYNPDRCTAQLFSF